MTGEPTPAEILDHEVTYFHTLNPDLYDPAAAHDRCLEVSRAFADRLRSRGIEAEVVAGARVGEDPMFPGVRLFLGGHYAVQVGDTIYDWTARQFRPDAPVPWVLPAFLWRREWSPLEEVSTEDRMLPEPEALGPCGCVGEHERGCPLRTGGAMDTWARNRARQGLRGPGLEDPPPTDGRMDP